MAETTMTINPLLPPRRWSRSYLITPSDTNTERNLQYNGKIPYRFLHNSGTGGSVVVTYEPDNATATADELYIPQGGFVEGGYWVHARATGLTAGMEIHGLVGVEGVEA